MKQKHFSLLPLLPLAALTCMGQVQIGPGVQIGGSGNGVAGSNRQVQINNGGAQGAAPVTMDSSGNIVTNGKMQGAVCDTGGQVYNVVCYGAVGDDVTDDWNAFNTAVGLVQSHGGCVFVPTPPATSGKKYKITKTLNFLQPTAFSPSLCMDGFNQIASMIDFEPTIPIPGSGAAWGNAVVSGPLSGISGISGGSGFSGSGTLFLTNFAGCPGSTATVTISTGAFASASITAGGTCTNPAISTTATCTSGTATCTGSPVTINVTAAYNGSFSPGAPTSQGAGYNQATVIKVSGLTCSGSTPLNYSYSPVLDPSTGAITGLQTLSGVLNATLGSGCAGTPTVTAVSYNPAILIQTTVTSTTQYGLHLHDFGITSNTANPNFVGIAIIGQRQGSIERVSVQHMGDGIQFPPVAGGSDLWQSAELRIENAYIQYNEGWGVAGYDGWGAGDVEVKKSTIIANSLGGIYLASNYALITGNSIAFNGCNWTENFGTGSPGSVVCDFNPFGNGGGLVLDRQPTGNDYNVIVQQNEFESNYLYHIWNAAAPGALIQNNKDNTWVTQWKDGWPHPEVHYLLGGWNYPNTTAVGQTRMIGNLHRMQNVAAGAPYDTDTVLYALLDNNIADARVQNPQFGTLVNNLQHYTSSGGVLAYVTVAGGVAGTVQIGWGGMGYTSTNTSALTWALPSTVTCSVQPTFGTTSVSTGGQITAVATSSGGSGCTNGTYALIPTPPVLTVNEATNRHFVAIESNKVIYSGVPTMVSNNGLGFMGNTPGVADVNLTRSGTDQLDVVGGDPSSPDTTATLRVLEDSAHWARINANSASSVIRFESAGKIPYFGPSDANPGELQYNSVAQIYWDNLTLHPVTAATLTLGTTAFPWGPVTVGNAASHTMTDVVSGLTGIRTRTWQDSSGVVAWTSQLTPVRAGTWTITSATSTPVTFSPAFGSTPTSCSLTPSASAATTGTPFMTGLNTAGFTVNVPTSGSISGTYQCVITNTN